MGLLADLGHHPLVRLPMTAFPYLLSLVRSHHRLIDEIAHPCYSGPGDQKFVSLVCLIPNSSSFELYFPSALSQLGPLSPPAVLVPCLVFSAF